MLQNSVVLLGFAIAYTIVPLGCVYDFGLLGTYPSLDANRIEISAAPENYVEPNEQQETKLPK